MHGTIAHLHLGRGGVPKLPVDSARVTPLGLEGDRHRISAHGGLDKALCLYSLEHLAVLRAEGHPIGPGSTGENVTITGLDWHALAPGMQLALGDEVVIAITEPAIPCRVIQGCFHDRRFGRIGAKKYPGWARLYARVLQPGLVARGQAVALVGT